MGNPDLNEDGTMSVGSAVASPHYRRAGTTSAASRRAQTIRELYELIAALDRRLPQVERVGETSIAQAASALKAEALRRIEELERDAPVSSSLP